MKKVIFNADDFGLTKGINRGILKCFKSEVVTDSSTLMNMEATDDSLKIAKKNNLNTGIHLTLTEGKPLSSEVSTLVDKNGIFFNILAFSSNLLLNKIKDRDIENEFRAQIEKFNSTGIEPTHIDTHQYIHSFPKILKIIIRLSKKYKINKVRYSYERPLPILTSQYFRKQYLKSLIVSILSRKTKDIFKKGGVLTTDDFIGITRINSTFVLKSFMDSLKEIKTGTTEIMCHPGYNDKILEKISSYNKQREDELRALTSPELKRKVEELNIKLISFRELN